MNVFNRFYLDEKGGGFVEYLLAICLISLAAITAITTLGVKIKTDMTSISTKL